MVPAPSVQVPAERIVITGGPGAAKTAVLELARRDLCKHVDRPESATATTTCCASKDPRHG